MATSGSVDFNRTRDQIIKAALRKIGALSEFETPSAEVVTNASEALNLLAKSWMADGMQLWLIDEGVLFLVKDQQKYTLGSGGDHATTSHIKTEVATAVSSGTSLVVDSTTGMTAADVLLLELDDGTYLDTTISSVDSSTALTLADAVPSAAAVDNHVYTYTTIINYPWRIIEMWHRDSGNNDTPLFRISREEYVDLSTKSSTGQPTQYFYDRQLNNGFLHIWPTASNLKDRIYFYFHREVEDFDAATDNPDFPKHYHRALVYGLAAELAPEYGVPIQIANNIEAKAQILKQEAMGYDIEYGSVYIGVENRG